MSTYRRTLPLTLAVALAAALGACERGVSTAGSYDPDRGVSTAGPFDDGRAPSGPGLAPDLAGEELRAAIDRDYSPDRTLGYGPARDALYDREQREAGAVCGVYTDYCVVLGGGDPSQAAGAGGINAEHVWPQSRGARAEPLRSDLHHLFPARETVNSSRGNLPFGEIPDDRADAWYREALSQSRPPRADIDGWSERGAGRFEPREDRKGDIARAVFYVAAVYPDRAEPGFLGSMLPDLLAWNRQDPPDARERARSTWVASLQGTENPFVLDPALADRIWSTGEATSVPPPAPLPPDPPPPSASGAVVRITEIHYDNVGDDVGEGVEVSGPAGASLDGWTLVLVNGNGGTTYQTVPLAGTVGEGEVWVPLPGLQNGSPDGIALVDPAGRVREALGYEGSFRSVDGVRFEEIGVSEPPDAAIGTSLQRVGGRWVTGRAATPGRPN